MSWQANLVIRIPHLTLKGLIYSDEKEATFEHANERVLSEINANIR